MNWASAHSLLVWGVGANAAFGLTFLLLFGVLRRSTSFARRWYAPRLHSAAANPAANGGLLQPVAPLDARFNWLFAVLAVSEEQLLAQAGLDAVVFVRLFSLGTRLFLVLSLVLVPALCPLYYRSAGAPPDKHGEVQWATALSVANLPRGSSRLWWPLAASYFSTALTLAFLRREYKHVAALRLSQLCARQAVPEAYALLCLDIPTVHAAEVPAAAAGEEAAMQAAPKAVRTLARAAESAADLATRAAVSVATGHSVTAPDSGAHAHAIEAEWRRLQPATEVRAVCVPYLPPVEAAFQAWRDALARAHEAILQERRDGADMRGAPTDGGETLHAPLLGAAEQHEAWHAMGLWRRKWTGAQQARDAASEASRARAALVAAQAAASQGPSCTAFLLFRSRRAACTAMAALLHANPLHWQLSAAPAPEEVNWVNLRLRWWERRIRGAWASSLSALIVLFFLFPVTAISSITMPVGLKETLPQVAGLVEGYLPGLALTGALTLVPLAFGHLALRQGCVSVSATDRQVASRVFAVLVLDVFLGSTVARATVSLLVALSSLQWDVSLSDVLALLGTSVSNNAPLFIGLLSVRALAGLPLELSRLSPMLMSAVSGDRWAATNMPYGTQVPNALLVVLLGLVYAPIAPVLLPFAALFFALGVGVWRYQLLFVYERPYETYGKFFPHIANRILVSLAISHATLAAVIALKLAGAVPLPGRHHFFSIALFAGPALLPLPVTVVIFARHYQRRFAPIFKRVPLSAAAEMGDVEDGWRFTASYVPQCMRPVQDLELEAPQLFTLPPPYDRIARGEAELQLQAALDDPIPM